MTSPTPMPVLRTVQFAVPGRPAAKGSRSVAKGPDGRTWTYERSGRARSHLAVVRAAARDAMAGSGPLAAPYAATLWFNFRRPAKPRREWPGASYGDLDKLVRLVLDGLTQGGAIEDDAHVLWIHAGKCFTSGTEHTSVTVETITDD